MPDNNVSGFPFGDLPRELQTEIIRSAIHTRQVTLSPILPRTTGDETLLSSRLSCRRINELILDDPLFRSAITDRHHRRLLMDVNVDTLRVTNMYIPNVGVYQPDRPGRGSLPIRSLVSINDGFLLRRGCFAPKAASLERFYLLGLKFKKSLPDQWFPNLEHFTLSVAHAAGGWNMEGFQLYGPETLAPFDPQCTWNLSLYDDARINEGARYLSQIGAISDTGIRWDFSDYLAMGYFKTRPREISTPGYAYKSICPYIGLRGYSDGVRSHGGHWAGFRLFVESGLLQFSPLNWSDVEHLIVDKTNRLETCMPQFIARVWIIRGTEKPPDDDDHSWIEVREPVDGDPPYVGQIADTWTMVRHQLDCPTPI
jgi:hypothetical protein